MPDDVALEKFLVPCTETGVPLSDVKDDEEKPKRRGRPPKQE